MVKHVVLQGWFGMNNLGDDLLLHVTLSYLLQTNLDIRVSVIGEGAYRPSFLRQDIRYIPRESRKWGWLRKRWLKSGCDWVLCGGSVLADEVLDRFIEPAQLVRKHGGSVFFHALGLRHDLTHGKPLQTLMGLVNRCSMREAHGHQILSRYMTVDLVGDPVFAIQHKPPVCENRLLIALRGEDVSLENTKQLVAWLRDTEQPLQGVDILVCFADQDLEASIVLQKALQGMDVRLLDNIDLDAKVMAILQAKRVLTMRLHPAIIALSEGVVPWVLAGEHKQQMLMKDMDKEAFLCDWDTLPQWQEEAQNIDAALVKAQGQKGLILLEKWVGDHAH
ncbi:polysaccharide pyruvyl transferase family protein [Mariprofundus ferrooxydans]|nr:polysaccharide pyruvyl transferase family protein [Mariprofundus ferrooxydans]